MPTTITRYKCNKCGGEYDTQAKATTCEGNHPGTISVSSGNQTFKSYSVMPDKLKVTHTINNVTSTYYYYLHT